MVDPTPPAGSHRIQQGVYGPLPSSASLPALRSESLAARDLFPLAPSRGPLDWDRLPFVLDASMLFKDILDAARGQGGSLLLAAVEKRYAHLYATEQVRKEIERNLERRALQAHVDPERAFAIWAQRFQPTIHFVSVDGVPRSRAALALAERHPNDIPTAVLAELLAPCLVFACDDDLTDCGIARRDWTAIVHNAEQAKQLEQLFGGGSVLILLTGVLGVEGVKALIRVARAAPLPAFAVSLTVGLLLHSHVTSTRGRAQLSGLREFVKDAGSALGEMMDVAYRAQAFVSAAAFVPEVEPTELAHAARAVAVAPEPVRASELAFALDVNTQKATHLLQHPMFTRREDARYVLGRTYPVIEAKPRVEIVRFRLKPAAEQP